MCNVSLPEIHHTLERNTDRVVHGVVLNQCDAVVLYLRCVNETLSALSAKTDVSCCLNTEHGEAAL